jgi:hypothetical protein
MLRGDGTPMYIVRSRGTPFDDDDDDDDDGGSLTVIGYLSDRAEEIMRNIQVFDGGERGRTSSRRSWTAPFVEREPRRLARRFGGVLLERDRCSSAVVASLSASERSYTHSDQLGRWVLAGKSSEGCRGLFERRPELESWVLTIRVVIVDR